MVVDIAPFLAFALFELALVIVFERLEVRSREVLARRQELLEWIFSRDDWSLRRYYFLQADYRRQYLVFWRPIDSFWPPELFLVDGGEAEGV